MHYSQKTSIPSGHFDLTIEFTASLQHEVDQALIHMLREILTMFNLFSGSPVPPKQKGGRKEDSEKITILMPLK
jgi:hypothetical protein